MELGGAVQEAVDSALSKYAGLGVDKIQAWESLGNLAKSKLDGVTGTTEVHFDIAVMGYPRKIDRWLACYQNQSYSGTRIHRVWRRPSPRMTTIQPSLIGTSSSKAGSSKGWGVIPTWTWREPVRLRTTKAYTLSTRCSSSRTILATPLPPTKHPLTITRRLFRVWGQFLIQRLPTPG